MQILQTRIWATTQVVLVAVCLLAATLGAVIAGGQGGTGRETPNSNKTAPPPKRTPSPRRTPRPTRSPGSAPNRESSESNSSRTDDAAANERTFWETIRDSSDPADFQAYLSKYPNGEFAALARNKLRRLEGTKAAASPTPARSEATPATTGNTNAKSTSGVSPRPSPPTTDAKVTSAAESNAGSGSAVKTPAATPAVTVPNPKDSGPITSVPAGSTESAVAKPVIGSSFKDAFGLEFVWIPPGTFKMGSSKRGNDEKPVRDVTINEGFYIGRNEVTQGEWQSIMATSIIQQRDQTNPAGALRGVGEQYPMYYVSWTDAQEFINRLNQKSTTYTYRLPTEAEWEYACRGGVADDYNGATDTMSWYANNSGRQRIDAAEIWRTDQTNYVKRIVDNGNQTHPVGQKQPNAFGLHDMNGNVWEWCEDFYHWGYAGAPLDASAWLINGEKDSRVLRGGSWDFNATFLSSTTRGGLAQETRGNYFGFRLVAVARSH